MIPARERFSLRPWLHARRSSFATGFTALHCWTSRAPTKGCSWHTRLCRAAGFTLVEVLTVVVIMAILAGVLIPRLTNSSDDAKSSTLKHNLYVIQTQVELYRAQHLNQFPTIKNNGLPQLSSATNAAGESGASGPLFPFGPYFLEPPMNPYDGSTKVVAVATPGEQPTAVVGTLGGWQYDASNGAVWPNDAAYYK